MMTATKSPRTVSVHWSDRYADRTIVSTTVKANGRSDSYNLFHADWSCEVTWVHADDHTRVYTVTCSAYDGRPTHCTCPARVVCRHRAATAVLSKRGHLHLPTVAGIVPPDCEYDFREAVDGVALAVAMK